MTEPSLTELADRYGSDKGTLGPTDAWPSHNYTDVYEAYLWQLRPLPLRLLEVGVGVRGEAWRALIAVGRNEGGGASLKMWADYFPAGRIFGVDVNDASHLETDRIRFFRADQGDAAALRRVVRAAGPQPFDVVVDDGSHRADHQQLTFGVLFPHLRAGGLYFIEDLMDNGTGGIHSGGRFASERPLRSTRDVFRTLAETGAFGRPNAIGRGARRAAAEVDWVHLHCPVHKVLLPKPGVETPPVVRYWPGSEQLCVVRRRG